MRSWLRFTPHLLLVLTLIVFIWLNISKLSVEPGAIAAAAGLIVLTYFSAIFMVGRAWALLPTVFLAFSPLLGSATYQELLATLTALAALDALGYFLLHPSRARGAVLALALLGATYGSFYNLWLLPSAILIICIAAAAGLFLYFSDIDPATRKNHFYLHLMRYGMPLLLILLIAIPGFIALGLLLPQAPFIETGSDATVGANIAVFLSANPVLEPLARYAAFFMTPREKSSFMNTVIQDLAWPGFLAVAWGALLAAVAAIASTFRHLPMKIFNPALTFIETRPLEFAYLASVAPALIFGLAYAPLAILILAANPLKSWCTGKSSYFSGGIRVNISAFDQRISNQALKYGFLATLLALQVFVALN